MRSCECLGRDRRARVLICCYAMRSDIVKIDLDGEAVGIYTICIVPTDHRPTWVVLLAELVRGTVHAGPTTLCEEAPGVRV